MINRNGSIVTTYTDIGHFTDQDKLTAKDDGVKFAFGLIDALWGWYDPYEYLDIKLRWMKLYRPANEMPSFNLTRLEGHMCSEKELDEFWPVEPS